MKLYNPFKKLAEKVEREFGKAKSAFEKRQATAEKNRLARLAKSCYLPKYSVKNGMVIATMKSGTQYHVRTDGWRRISR